MPARIAPRHVGLLRKSGSAHLYRLSVSRWRTKCLAGLQSPRPRAFPHLPLLNCTFCSESDHRAGHHGTIRLVVRPETISQLLTNLPLAAPPAAPRKGRALAGEDSNSVIWPTTTPTRDRAPGRPAFVTRRRQQARP